VSHRLGNLEAGVCRREASFGLLYAWHRVRMKTAKQAQFSLFQSTFFRVENLEG